MFQHQQQQQQVVLSPLEEKLIPTNQEDPNNNNQQPSCPAIIEEKIVNANGEESIIKYVKGRFLGKGGFAKCYELRYAEPNSLQQKSKVYAVKVVPKATLQRTKARQKLQSEIKIHKSLSNEFVVKFDKYFEDKENVYMLLEICNNQSLNELVRRRKRVTELEAQCYLLQLIKASEYLLKTKVIHRDLKLGNLFLNEKMQLKVGDFGLAAKVLFEGEKKRTICGTPNYIAPEILDAKIGHSYEVDYWSIGVILYTLLYGRPPFESPEVKQTYKKIKSNQYQFPDTVVVSDQAKDFIRSLLKTDPSQRMNLKEMLAHEFMNMNKIPDFLPISTLVCPPSATYVKQYLPLSQQYATSVITNNNNDFTSMAKITNHHNDHLNRFEQTAPVQTAVASARLYNMNMGIAQTSSRCTKDQKGGNIMEPFGGAFSTTRDNAQLFNPETQRESHRYQTASATTTTAITAASTLLTQQSPRQQQEFQFGKPKLDNFMPAASGRPATTPNKNIIVENKMLSVSPHQIPTTPRAILEKRQMNKELSTSPIVSGLNRMVSQKTLQEKENAIMTAPQTPINSNNFALDRPSARRVDNLQQQQQVDEFEVDPSKKDQPMAKIEMTMASHFGIDKLLYLDSKQLQQSQSDLITQFVDFSSKYGMGYKLSNGSYGVLFNDSTKIVLDPNCFHFNYISRGPNSQEDEVQNLDFFNYPKFINKKVILLQHFKSYLDGNQKFKPIDFKFTTENAPKRQNTNVSMHMSFLKKWKRAKKAILFRLSNKIIQVIFQDQSELILCSGNGMVTFVNSKKQIKKLPLSSDLESKDPSMYKRLQYAKEILIQLINKQEHNHNGANKYLLQDKQNLLEKTQQPNTNELKIVGNNKRPFENAVAVSHRVGPTSSKNDNNNLVITNMKQFEGQRQHYLQSNEVLGVEDDIIDFQQQQNLIDNNGLGVIHGTGTFHTARNENCQSAGTQRKSVYPSSINNIHSTKPLQFRYQTNTNAGYHQLI